jgi:hypothetical protein
MAENNGSADEFYRAAMSVGARGKVSLWTRARVVAGKLHPRARTATPARARASIAANSSSLIFVPMDLVHRSALSFAHNQIQFTLAVLFDFLREHRRGAGRVTHVPAVGRCDGVRSRGESRSGKGGSLRR